VTTIYTYDGEDILREVAGSTTLKYIHGPGVDEALAKEDGLGVLSFYHADGLGSIVKATNVLGLTVGSRRYDAWGNIEDESGPPLPNELGGGGYAFTDR
jgi:uncharacterized protein RhaS with RHS repeats